MKFIHCFSVCNFHAWGFHRVGWRSGCKPPGCSSWVNRSSWAWDPLDHSSPLTCRNKWPRSTSKASLSFCNGFILSLTWLVLIYDDSNPLQRHSLWWFFLFYEVPSGYNVSFSSLSWLNSRKLTTVSAWAQLEAFIMSQRQNLTERLTHFNLCSVQVTSVLMNLWTFLLFKMLKLFQNNFSFNLLFQIFLGLLLIFIQLHTTVT